MKKRLVLMAFTAIAAGVAITSHAQAPSTYPSKTIRFVVPFPAGTAPDVIARILGDHMAKNMGQPVMVDNRPGAAGMIGADNVAKSSADGYTVFMAVNSILAINPHVYAKSPYNARTDFAGVTQLTLASYALISTPSFPVSSVADLVAQAKAQPGKIAYASPGVGSAPHVIMEQLNAMSGTSMNHVPFKTTGLTEVMAGQVPVSFEPIATAVPMIKSGKVRALAVTSPKRMAVLPEVPAVAETLTGFDGDGWHGVMVHAQTPKPIITRLHSEVTRALRLPDVQQKLTDLGLTIVGNSPEEFDRVIRQDYDRWGRVVKAANIRLD